MNDRWFYFAQILFWSSIGFLVGMLMTHYFYCYVNREMETLPVTEEREKKRWLRTHCHWPPSNLVLAVVLVVLGLYTIISGSIAKQKLETETEQRQAQTQCEVQYNNEFARQSQIRQHLSDLDRALNLRSERLTVASERAIASLVSTFIDPSLATKPEEERAATIRQAFLDFQQTTNSIAEQRVKIARQRHTISKLREHHQLPSLPQDQCGEDFHGKFGVLPTTSPSSTH